MNWRGKGGDKKAEPGWGWEGQTHRERQTDVPIGERERGREGDSPECFYGAF